MNKTIFLLEDQVDKRDQMADFLGEQGYNVVQGRSYHGGVRAVHDYLQAGNQFDRLIIDRQVPFWEQDDFPTRRDTGIDTLNEIVRVHLQHQISVPRFAMWSSDNYITGENSRLDEMMKDYQGMYFHKDVALNQFDAFLRGE